ncbi:MAG TPA: ABC transporter permease [Acetobacteraceae bacterium]|nr:ABC transporter permease [Acetobacteraceae bacterium]
MSASAALTAADPALAAAVRRTTRGQRVRALLLVAPLLALLLLSFCLPIGMLLSRAVYDPATHDALPRTASALAASPGNGVPDDAVFAALGDDLLAAKQNDSLYSLAKDLNNLVPAARSHVLRMGRYLTNEKPSTRAGFVEADPFWGEASTWVAIRSGIHTITTSYLLAAVDLRWMPDGGIGQVSPDQAIYRTIFARTFGIALAVTLITLILGFPLAWLLAHVPGPLAARLIMLVLLPFWTSILVRTAAWTVLLQKFGILNEVLLALHIADHRFDLMYTRTGLIIAMVHIQLPFTLLPIYSIMRTISASQMRAAYSLGARPFFAFRRVYLPQVMPGVMAGCLLTFILCLGYFITPALVGGPADQLIANFISNYINVDLNWQMAGALSCILLVLTLGLFAVFARMFGIDRMKLI